MKKLLLVLIIFATGTTIFCGFHNATVDLRQMASHQQAAWQTETQSLSQARIEREQLIQQIGKTKSQLAWVNGKSAGSNFDPEFSAKNAWQNFSAEQAEKLLAELGFNWNTTGDYLIVSKKSLSGISFDGINGAKLTEAARAVLAITPEEQIAIENTVEKLKLEHAAWVTTHVQREEPSGDIVAKYSLPIDTAFSQTRSNTFVTAIHDTLGSERGELLESYAYSWMQDAGMLDSQFSTDDDKPKGTEMTLNRYKHGDEWQINYTFTRGNSRMSTSISPGQPFPPAFKPLFPGGWRDLAAHEGFELPKSFKKKEGR